MLRRAINMRGCGLFYNFRQKTRNTDINRTILSQSYISEDLWEKRGEEVRKSLPKFKFNEFLYEVERQLRLGGKVNAVDLDVLLWGLPSFEPALLQRLLELIYRLRHSHLACEFMDSSCYAFVRQCLFYTRVDLVFKALKDTINYGVFPDYHEANILFDHCLESDRVVEAGYLATHLMLQEMFDNKISNYLSLISCVKTLEEKFENLQEHWDKIGEQVELIEQEEEESVVAARLVEEEEEIYFKLPYLKNLDEDEHLDITDPYRLIGKTLSWLNVETQPTNSEKVAKLLGLVNFGKITEATDMAKKFGKDVKLTDQVTDLLTKSIKQYESAVEKSDKLQESEKGQIVGEIGELKNSLNSVETSNERVSSLSEDLQSQFLAHLPILEQNETEKHRDTFEEFSENRIQQLNYQVKRRLMEMRLAKLDDEIELAKKDELKATFFKHQLEWEKSASLEDEELLSRRRLVPWQDTWFNPARVRLQMTDKYTAKSMLNPPLPRPTKDPETQHSYFGHTLIPSPKFVRVYGPRQKAKKLSGYDDFEFAWTKYK